MQKHKETAWDIAVIGGGPSGMMAAGRAAELGAKVVLLEKNDSLGKKLLITGGGRCNVTNAELDIRTFLARYGASDKFLFSAFSQWSSQETLDFFHVHNMPTKIEPEKRVFPQSDSAQSVWDVMVRYIKKNGVTILSQSAVSELVVKKGSVVSVKLENGKEIFAKKFIIATGGSSRPETGSTGDGFIWLEKIGHTIVPPDPALVPVAIKNAWVKKLQGISMPEIKITLFQNGTRHNHIKGKILFTHFGVSGPAVLNLSKDIGELLKHGEAILSLDLFPALSKEKIDEELQKIFTKNSNKKFKNSLSSLLPSALGTAIVVLSKINPDTFCHSVTRAQRLILGALMKDIRISAERLLGSEKAIVSSGGVLLEEIDFKTMTSRLYPNLYLVGDILNVNRPSGGFSLQLCWTTGYVAGNAAAKQ